jgi:micrococcal nuclease
VVDGNTIDVKHDGCQNRVRDIGMNTPELNNAGGPEASPANRQLVERHTVHIELDEGHWDPYQRLLAYVYIGNVMVTAELLRQGSAKVMTIRPNVRYQHQFLAFQPKARDEGAGCWGMAR